MFRSARIKLTAWYLLIIIVISGTLSLMIFRQTTTDLQRRFGTIERRFLSEQRPLQGRMPPHLRLLSVEFNAAKQQLILRIVVANGLIIILSATAAYFLAGKTLAPIERATEEQNRFLTDASHELRTPLTALKTSIEVALRDKKMSAKAAKGVLQSSLEDVGSLETLTTDLLSLAQHQKRSDSIQVEQVDVSDIVQAARKKVEAVAEQKGVGLDIKARSLAIEADKAALEEMLVNLLDNGVKYTPKGGHVSFSMSHDSRQLHLKVSDTGIGIYAVDTPHIFDRFYKVDKSRSKTKTPGFGLGLSIAKRIVDLHRGKITVASTPNEGTTFTISLPLKQTRN